MPIPKYVSAEEYSKQSGRGEKMNNIKNFRKKKNLSQSDISKILEIKQNTFSQWETGERIPNVKQAIKMAEILETTVESLYK